jgi:putative serine protease PepD
MHKRLIPAAAGILVIVLSAAACASNTPVGSSPPAGSSAASAPASAPAATASPSAAPTVPVGTDGTSAAEELQSGFVSVVKKVSPSVVVIETDQGLGSGVIFDSDGHIVTNAHVVANASTFRVTLASGKTLDASLVGAFVQDDLAVLKVPADSALQPATFGDSSSLLVGDIVMAIGNPLGLQSSVTEGIVSALNRTVSEPGGIALPGVIQTSAAINPGNSGGALVDLEGHVVGIPTLTATDPQIGGAAPGIGFAIPSNTARDIAQQLITYGHVVNSHRAYLGIQGADTFAGQGVYVYRVDAGGPAATAGITNGDVITAIGGQATPDDATLAEVIAGHQPGDTVSVTVIRPNGSQTQVSVRLGEVQG